MPDAKRPCPSRHDLLAFNSGELSFADLERIADHLDDCTDCLAVVETLDAADDQVVAALRATSAAQSWFNEVEFRRLNQRAKGIGLSQAAPQVRSQVTGRSPQDRFTGVDLPCQLGEYRLLQELGRGGMGVVYRAEHVHLKRSRAVKLLPQERTRDPKFVKRFYREIEAAGAVEHPHVVRATDAREADGVHFLVMEYVHGTDLAELLRQQRTLPVPEACEIVRQAAEGLCAISQAGLVHRDIKPSNLMLDATGTIKILDLGLARLRKESAQGDLTHSDQLLGSVDYMAPEQARDSKSVDIRADLYSLGCTFYQLLTGRPPFAAPRFATIESKILAHCQSPVPPLRDVAPHVPPPLAALVDRLLAKDVGDRFESPEDVAELLSDFAKRADLPRLFRDRAEKETQPDVERQATTVTLPRRDTQISQRDPASPRGARKQPGILPRQILLRSALLLVLCGTAPLVYVLYVNSDHWLPTAWSSSRHVLPDDDTAWRTQEVTVHETLWRPTQTSSRKILGQSSLHVFSEDVSLLGIGMYEQGDLTFRVNMRQLEWSGRIGVFFGFRPGDENTADKGDFQVIEIVFGPEGEFLLTRRLWTFRADDPWMQNTSSLAQVHVGDFRTDWNNLEIRIRDGRLVSVLLNGVDHVPLVQNKKTLNANSWCTGRFGVYNQQSSGVFSGFRLNDQPLNLSDSD